MGGGQQVFNGVFVEHPAIIAKNLSRPKTPRKTHTPPFGHKIKSIIDDK